MSFKGYKKLAIIITYVHLEILGNFLILSIENWLGNVKVIFQGDNASYPRAMVD